MRKKRESYCSMSKEQFLNPETGAFKRLDNTAWHTKFQEMPPACFKATIEGTPDINVEVIEKDIAAFMEEHNG